MTIVGWLDRSRLYSLEAACLAVTGRYRLSDEEIDRMVQEAEEFKDQVCIEGVNRGGGVSGSGVHRGRE